MTLPKKTLGKRGRCRSRGQTRGRSQGKTRGKNPGQKHKNARAESMGALAAKKKKRTKLQ